MPTQVAGFSWARRKAGGMGAGGDHGIIFLSQRNKIREKEAAQEAPHSLG